MHDRHDMAKNKVNLMHNIKFCSQKAMFDPRYKSIGLTLRAVHHYLLFSNIFSWWQPCKRSQLWLRTLSFRAECGRA